MTFDMDRRRFLTLGLSTAAAVGLGSSLLSACSSVGGTGGSTSVGGYSYGPPTGGTPKRGGTGTIGMLTGGPAETVDVRLSGINPDLARVYALYDYLFYVDLEQSNGLRPGLALEATPNSDATVWHLKLRDGVVWHDGKPFTSADVVYTVRKSWADPANHVSVVLESIIDFDNVKSDGKYGVTIPLKRPVAEFPSITAIQNCGVVQDGFTDWNNPVGTGAFKMKSFVPGSRSEFLANANWWGDGPYLDALVIDSSYTESQTMVDALLAGNVDIVPGMPPALGAAYARSGQIHLGNQMGNTFQAATFRPDVAPFTDPAVVKALKLSFNSADVVEHVYNGYATPGLNIVGQGDPFYASDLKIVHDPDQAWSLLAKAGMSNLPLELNTAAQDAQTNGMAAVVQDQLRNGGFDVSIKQWSPAIYQTAASGYRERAFSMDSWVNATHSLTLFNLTYWVSDSPWGIQHWGTPEHDAAIYGAIAELDPQRAAEKWHAVQADQSANGGMLSVNPNFFDAYGLKVRGVRTTTAGYCDGYNFGSMWLDR